MKLSIIFPVYNERATSREILDRVLEFSMEGLETEVLIVEGNSTDGTREIVREYEGRPGVRIFFEDRAWLRTISSARDPEALVLKRSRVGIERKN